MAPCTVRSVSKFSFSCAIHSPHLQTFFGFGNKSHSKKILHFLPLLTTVSLFSHMLGTVQLVDIDYPTILTCLHVSWISVGNEQMHQTYQDLMSNQQGRFISHVEQFSRFSGGSYYQALSAYSPDLHPVVVGLQKNTYTRLTLLQPQIWR